MTPGEPRPRRPGSRLAPGYRVVGHLSRGRPMDVYDVWSERRRTRCVAKCLRPSCADDPRHQRRLRREGRLLTRLAHPHLVRAYEVLHEPGTIVILEPLPGATLDLLIEEAPRRLAASDVALLGRQLCSVLGYLHEAGVVHLDLKPSNVVVHAGRATLIDLSVARAAGRVRAGVGTPAYMAPEQIRGGRVDAATDVWGLGGILYEAATGTMPFDSGADGDPTRRAAPVRALRRLPRDLGAAIDDCLRADPRERPTVNELWERLGAGA